MESINRNYSEKTFSFKNDTEDALKYAYVMHLSINPVENLQRLKSQCCIVVYMRQTSQKLTIWKCHCDTTVVQCKSSMLPMKWNYGYSQTPRTLLIRTTSGCFSHLVGNLLGTQSPFNIAGSHAYHIQYKVRLLLLFVRNHLGTQSPFNIASLCMHKTSKIGMYICIQK